MNSDPTKIESKYRVIGVMSGTSLDGLDLALVEFKKTGSSWQYEILQTNEIEYDQNFKAKLSSSIELESADLSALDIEFGKFIGRTIKKHFDTTEIDFVASHGHTVYHQPEKNITLQIGDAKQIFENAGLPVVNDFRSLDVSKGGQGAPLVPIGDQLLFSNYDCCLNLGGIANCSFESNYGRIAYDLIPFNMVLNPLAEREGLAFDRDGQLARNGHLIPSLKEELSQIDYYQRNAPKSLGYEDFQKVWRPLILESSFETADIMHTYVLHAAEIISRDTNLISNQESELLVTGGGAFHSFFIEQLQKDYIGKVVVPSKELINFKEAIIFAFLGVLRFRNENNCLASVTGASSDSSSGKMTGFKEKII